MLTGLFGRCLARIESFIYFSLDLLQFTCSSTRSSLGTIGSGILAFACLIFTLSSDLRYTNVSLPPVFLDGKGLSGMVADGLHRELGGLLFTASTSWHGFEWVARAV